MLNIDDYQEIFQNTPDGMSVSRLDDGMIIEVNDTFRKMFAYDHEEVIGKTSYELKLWHNYDDRKALVKQLSDSAEVDNFETVLNRSDGSQLHIMLSARMVTLKQGSCLLASYKNVTSKTEMVLALQASEKKFKAVFDTSPDSIIISDEHGIIHDVNTVFERASGYSREETIGRSTLEIGLWEDPKRRDEFLSRLQQDGQVQNFEIEARTSQGDVGVFLVSAMPAVIDGERRILSIVRDVTELKKTEKMLRQEELRYRALSHEQQLILEAIPDAVVLWSNDRNVLWTNRNAESYLKVKQEKAIGKNCKALCQIGHEHEKCPLYQCLKREEAFETMEKLSDGETWDIKAFPLFAEDGHVNKVLTLSRNITESMRLREEVSRSSRLTALGELAAGVAHEINNPTGLILMNSSLARDVAEDLKLFFNENLSPPETLRLGGLAYQKAIDELPGALTEAIESGQRIKQIVEDLKDFSKPVPHDTFEPVDLNDVVEKSLRLTRIAISKATDNFAVDYDKTLPKVMGNARQLEQVMVNLISNACQALQDKSESLVVAVFGEPEEKMVCVKVWDEGRGIEEKNLSHVVDPFFTTRRESGGTGLGLSVSSRIIEEHQGHLYFESTPKFGTTVTIKLPAFADDRGRGI